MLSMLFVSVSWVSYTVDQRKNAVDQALAVLSTIDHSPPEKLTEHVGYMEDIDGT
tara:strand:- start:2020 stop:2184 length:165 start_codon:yes stop_codon:yes gene_type:complete